ncbi:YesL family protein [Neobacillus drentensis]|uniref:YesL family protein n=1 Tax=Neobacillus drentensis TaxID=220684 RepID=UPI002FFDF6DC
MEKIFGIEGRIFSTLAKIFDLLMLNIVFLIGCLPIVTIGASMTALYSVTLKMVRDEECYVVKDFWSSFKKNLKQSSIFWLAALFGLTSFIFLAQAIVHTNNTVVLFPLLFLVTVSVLTFMYVFPLIAKFENSSVNILKNAFFMCLHSTAYSIILFIITIFFVGLIPIYFPKLLFIWLFLGFSGSAFVKSFLFEKIFNTYVKK